MLHDEGVASCSSAPGLASAAREGGGEAWVGVVQAEGLSREILRSPGCRRCTKKRKALSSAALARVVGEPRAVRAPRACTKLSVLRTGRPRGRPCLAGDASSLRGSRGGRLVGAGREGNASAVIPR